jgi:hypothetical protein
MIEEALDIVRSLPREDYVEDREFDFETCVFVFLCEPTTYDQNSSLVDLTT